MNLPAHSMFQMPEDGWFQLSATGSFPHATTGLVQVIDDDAIAAIVQKFTEEATKPNFPGVLVDWDHSSLDLDKPTEAAGWIVALQQRPDGLWGQVRWSDRGAEAVSGGRYRFMSPVWRQEDCLDLGEKKVRPLRLFNCALTNDPNIKGMVPLANSARPVTNRNLTDEQLRAIHAKGGGGGSGGGSGGSGGSGGGSGGSGGSSGGGSSGSSSEPEIPEVGKNGVTKIEGGMVYDDKGGHLDPRLSTTPEQAAEKAAARGENPAIAALKHVRSQLDAYRNPKPEAPSDYTPLDPRAIRDAMLRQGKSLNEATSAERAAKARNDQMKAERHEFKLELRRAGYSDDQIDKAWDKKLERDQKDYDKAMSAWQTREARIDKEQAKLDVQIGKEQAAQERRDEAAKSAEEKEADRQREKAVRDQVARDKEAARLAEAERKREEQNQRKVQEDREKNDPVRTYGRELTKRRTYWDALSRGDKAYAERIFPGADHQKNAGAMKQVSGWKDKAARLRDTEPM